MTMRPHEKIIRQSVIGMGFRDRIPDGFGDAQLAGLVQEADPHWSYSDSYRASNGVALTESGRKLAKEYGYTCSCPWCSGLAMPGEMCGMCEAGISQYGMIEGGCKFHYKNREQ